MDPVIVIGAGPVGQTAALLLARWGVPVVVLDKRARRETVGSRAICQQRDVLDVWESVGAGAAIAHRGVTWRTARTFYRDTELFAVEFSDAGRSPFPPWVNISQAETEAVLDERIAQSPHIEQRWGADVVGIEQDAGSAVVTLSDGTRLAAPYVLACAGAGGDVVRDALGLDFDGQGFDDRFVICDIRADLGDWAHERRFYFDPEWNPGRQVLIHACPDSTYRIDWQVPSDYDAEADDVDARIRAIVGERPYEIVWRSLYRFQSRIVPRMRVGRVLLLGDLAHLVAPFGARGLNSGVWDAENAAWKVAHVLHGWSGDTLLDSYHDERHAAARENLDVTSATMRFLVPQTGAERDHRLDVLERAAGDDSAVAAIDSGRMAEPYWYVGSPLTTPDPMRPFAGRPAKGQVPPAGPGVIVPDVPVSVAGRRTFLRRIARDGVLAIVSGDVDPLAIAAALQGTYPGASTAWHVQDLDSTGTLAAALGCRAGEVWIVRPDAHVAAVLTEPRADDVRDAVRRAIRAV